MSVYDNVSDLFGLALLVGEELEAAQELVHQQKEEMGLSTIEGAVDNVLGSIQWIRTILENTQGKQRKMYLHYANVNLTYFQKRVEEEIAKATI